MSAGPRKIRERVFASPFTLCPPAIPDYAWRIEHSVGIDQSGLDDLRDRARLIAERLSESPRERPLFVEFSGSPKSGKSTCIDIVAHFFRRVGFKVLAPAEGASKRTPYYLKDDLAAFNTWSADYALNHVLEGLYHSDRFD